MNYNSYKHLTKQLKDLREEYLRCQGPEYRQALLATINAIEQLIKFL